MTDSDARVDNEGRLLFGSGFVFGVVFTLLVLSVVVVSVTEGITTAVLEAVVLPIVAGVVLAGLVGVGLYVLAFPENQVVVPFGDALDDERARQK